MRSGWIVSTFRMIDTMTVPISEGLNHDYFPGTQKSTSSL